MNETYHELMELWLKEQEIRLIECQNIIARNNEEIELLKEFNDLNQKQSVLIQKQINDGKEEHEKQKNSTG